MIKHLSDLVVLAKDKRKRKIAVAAAGDLHVLEALQNAYAEGIVEPVLFGDKAIIEKIAGEINFDISNIEVVDVPDPYKASLEAVKLISDGKAEIEIR